MPSDWLASGKLVIISELNVGVLMSSQQHCAAQRFHLIISHVSEVFEGDPLLFLGGYIKGRQNREMKTRLPSPEL